MCIKQLRLLVASLSERNSNKKYILVYLVTIISQSLHPQNKDFKKSSSSTYQRGSMPVLWKITQTDRSPFCLWIINQSNLTFFIQQPSLVWNRNSDPAWPMEVRWKCRHIYRTANHVADSSIYMTLWKDALQASNLGPGKFMRSIRFPFFQFLLLQNLSRTIWKWNCPFTTAATE